jgi:hypothetical protein
MAHHMPGRLASHIFQFRQLGAGFLNPIFPEVAESGFESGSNSGGIVCLGDGDEGYFIR